MPEKPTIGRAAKALTASLLASGVTQGALFRRIQHNRATAPLSGQAVWLIVKRRAKLAGLDPRLFGAHSVRAAFATEAGRQNIPLPEAMALTGQPQHRLILEYFHAGAVQHSRAADLLGA